jgi:L-amino acid N-acyltransferase YncA
LERGKQLLSPGKDWQLTGLQIRDAGPADVAAMLAIYRPHVEESAVSFELAVPGIDDFSARVAKAQTRWSWLVAEIDGVCTGYAYGTALRDREAYRWSVEVSAYVHPAHQRRGIASALYRRLLAELQQRGFCQAFACIALPNPASVAMHEKLGFVQAGSFRSVGRKFGRWHDIAWLQRELRPEPPQG